MTPRRFWVPLFKWFSFIAAVLKLRRGGDNALYLPISGGLRQLIDISFVLPAKLLGFRLFVHHHSFAYLNDKPWFSRIAFGILRSANHIVLCRAMGQQLCKQYDIAPERIRVLSNAAFLDIDSRSGGGGSKNPERLTVGFLSNITAEKGIFCFFDALDALRSRHIPFKAMIAGPVSPEVKAEFEARLVDFDEVAHVGAVYGDTKAEFFGQLDLLLFPTLYANEAEPVTLWEAMAHSVPIVALQRGCIHGIVPAEAGRVVADPLGYADAVCEEVLAMSNLPLLLSARRTAARVAFDAARLQSMATLRSLLQEMTANSVEVGKK